MRSAFLCCPSCLTCAAKTGTALNIISDEIAKAVLSGADAKYFVAVSVRERIRSVGSRGEKLTLRGPVTAALSGEDGMFWGYSCPKAPLGLSDGPSLAVFLSAANICAEPKHTRCQPNCLGSDSHDKKLKKGRRQ